MGVTHFRACHCCGLVHTVKDLLPGQEACCIRCHSSIDSGSRSASRSSARCLAAASGAVLLYFPAILLPILEIEKLGHHHRASLLGGTVDLLREGQWLVGGVVLVFSILLPLFKLLALLELSWIGLTHRKHRAWTYRMVEWTGRWSMMDVLLLALAGSDGQIRRFGLISLRPSGLGFRLVCDYEPVGIPDV